MFFYVVLHSKPHTIQAKNTEMSVAFYIFIPENRHICQKSGICSKYQSCQRIENLFRLKGLNYEALHGDRKGHIEAVCNSVAISFVYLLRVKIRCHNGEKVGFVSLCPQVNDWSNDVAIIHYFNWLCTQIINSKHFILCQFKMILRMVTLTQLSDMQGIYNSQSIASAIATTWGCRWTANLQR